MTQPKNGSTNGSSDGPASGAADGSPPDGATAGAGGGGTATAAPPAAPPAAPEAPPQKRKMKRSTRVALLVVAVLALIAAGGFTAYYVLDTRHYVSTDNAQVDGDKIDINAPAAGYLIDWRARQGADLRLNEVVGRIRVDGGFVQPQRPIRSPGNATVAVDNGVPGAYVTAGTNLATAYDLSRVYVTARVDETDVDAVRAGQKVDFTVDAFPNASFTGVVREIQSGAAGQFSLFPQSNTTGNFQKVTQVVPVKIAIDDLHGLALVPGMNVVVKIHKDT
jgi:multidrug resistance efflux pump